MNLDRCENCDHELFGAPGPTCPFCSYVHEEKPVGVADAGSESAELITEAGLDVEQAEVTEDGEPSPEAEPSAEPVAPAVQEEVPVETAPAPPEASDKA